MVLQNIHKPSLKEKRLNKDNSFPREVDHTYAAFY